MTIKRRFLLSTAVLLAGISLASAQGMREDVGGGDHGKMGAGAARGHGAGTAPAAAAGGAQRGPMGAGAAHGHGAGAAPATTAGGAQRGPMGAGQGAHEAEQSQPAMRRGDVRETTGAASHEATETKKSTGGETLRRGRAETGEMQRGRLDRSERSGRATRHIDRAESKALKSGNRSTANKANLKSSEDTQSSRRQADQKPAQQSGGGTAGQNNASTRSTTGQAPASAQNNTQTQSQATTSGSVSTATGRTITAQQQTTIQSSVLSANNVPRVNNVNFALRTGVFVPRSINFISISAFPVLLDVFPYYRDYDFFVAEDEIVFVTRERRIVDVVPIGPRAHFAQGSSSDVLLTTEEIREVQRVLVARGFDVEVDGVFGPRTREALISFQRRQGFRTFGLVNGRIDAQTVTALGVSNKISQEHIQGSVSSTTGQGTAQQSPPNAQQPSNQSTDGKGAQQPSAQAPANQGNAAQAPANRGSAEKQPNAQTPANRSTTGQAPTQSSPNAANQGSPQHGNQGAPQAAEPQKRGGSSTSGQGNAQPQHEPSNRSPDR